MAVANALETAAIGIDGGEALGHVRAVEGCGDPLGEVAPATAESVARLDEMEKQRAQVDLGQGVPELLQSAGLVTRGYGDQMSLEEAEGLYARRRWSGREMLEMIADGRHQLLAHLLQRARFERVDGGQPFGQPLVPQLETRPIGEIIRISRGQRRPVQEGRRGMAEERFDGHAPHLIQELANVPRLVRKQLLEIDAAVEDEGLGAHGVLSERYQRTAQGPSS